MRGVQAAVRGDMRDDGKGGDVCAEMREAVLADVRWAVVAVSCAPRCALLRHLQTAEEVAKLSVQHPDDDLEFAVALRQLGNRVAAIKVLDKGRTGFCMCQPRQQPEDHQFVDWFEQWLMNWKFKVEGLRKLALEHEHVRSLRGRPVDQICQVLEVAGSGELAKSAACLVLQELASRGASVGSDAIQLVISAMQASAVQRSGCGALRTFATCLEKDEIVRLGGIEAVHSAMLAHPLDVELQSYGCLALSHLGSFTSRHTNQSISLVLSVLRNHRPRAQTSACMALRTLARNPANIDRMWHLDTAFLILQVMSSQNTHLLHAMCCEILMKLAVTMERCKKIGELRGVHIVVQGMANYLQHDDVIVACRALERLVVHPDNSSDMWCCNGLQVVDQVMRMHQERAEIIRSCLLLLHNICLDDERLAELNPVLVVRAMAAHRDDEEVQLWSCAVLRKVSVDSEQVKQIDFLGGATLLCYVLGDHHREEVLVSSLRALQRMAQEARVRSRLRELHADELVLNVMEWSSNADVQCWACKVLVELAHDHRLCDCIGSRCAVVIQAMVHVEVQVCACSLLSRLACNGHNRHCLREVDAIGVVMGMSGCEGTEATVCEVLWRLCFDDAARSRITELGGIEVLCREMTRREVHLRRAGCAALFSLGLGKHAHRTNERIRVAGGFNLVIEAMSEHVQDLVLQRFGCGALRNLSKVGRVTAAGVVALWEALTAFPKDTELARFAIAALLNSIQHREIRAVKQYKEVLKEVILHSEGGPQLSLDGCRLLQFLDPDKASRDLIKDVSAKHGLTFWHDPHSWRIVAKWLVRSSFGAA